MEGDPFESDRQLATRVALGDSAALRQIYDRCVGRAYAIALRILRTRADAEEVIQETFLQVWKKAREYDPRRGGLEAWVVTIARTRAIDRMRGRGAATRLTEHVQFEPVPESARPLQPDVVAESHQEQARVRAALAQLPLEQRAVLELAFYEGLSHRDISERTGQPLGTVKTRVRLGMLKLSTLLG
jgi:RNA polymerase sigma-70 factor (ECF subfamily)